MKKQAFNEVINLIKYFDEDQMMKLFDIMKNECCGKGLTSKLQVNKESTLTDEEVDYINYITMGGSVEF